MIYGVFHPEDGPINYNLNLKSLEVKRSFFPWSEPNSDTTYRDIMISFSESWMKPNFGPDIFGRLAFSRCVEQEQYFSHFLFDDNGFAPEAEHIIKMAGPSNCLLIHVVRGDRNFDEERDSRSFISLPCRTLQLSNDSDPEDMIPILRAALAPEQDK
jgi:hypothetical protein